MSLSMKNQWMDDEGRAYIYYSLEDIMEALGCSNKKAISIMKELDTDAGIGLIEKKRQGQGKPTMIYLKQFMVQDVQKCRNYISEQKTGVSEVKNLHVLKCKNVISRSEEITLPEVKNIHTNKNNINNTELSNTESYLIVSGNDEIGSDVQAYTDKREPYGIDESWLDVTDSATLKGDGFHIAQEISSRMKKELGITVSVGVLFNKIFAKLGSDYKKPDAITTMYEDEF